MSAGEAYPGRPATGDRRLSPPPPTGGDASDRHCASYEAASARLDEIVRRLDSGEAGLRETLELCQEGRRLVEYCAGELDAVGQGLQELRLEDLVARLEGGVPRA